MKEDYLLINDEANQQFEFRIMEYTPLIEYYMNPEKDVFLTHTEVPTPLEGKGVGSALVEKTLEYIAKRNMRVVPLCPFVVSYIKKHPEWLRIVKTSK